MRFLLPILGVVFLIAFGATIFEFYFGSAEAAIFFVRWLAALGTFCAVCVALFSEYLRANIDPIHVKIDVPVEKNNVLDHRGIPVYCHHLRVVNLTSHKPIKDAQVWLKYIFDEGLDGKWEENWKSPVPRLMEWAPSEFSKDKRTFAKEQIFDLGQTRSENGGFELTVHGNQGGTFQRIRPPGRKYRLVFMLTAENYLGTDEFEVEIDVPRQTGAVGTVIPSKVALVTERNWRIRG